MLLQGQEKTIRNYVLLICLFWAALGTLIIHQNIQKFETFPETWNVNLRDPIDDFQVWTIKNRNSHPLFIYGFQPLSSVIDYTLRQIEKFMLWLPWQVITLFFFLIVHKSANLRTALVVAFCALAMGAMGLWDKSMQTLSLVMLSVSITLILGIPLGILTAFSKGLEKLLRPVLDAMQTLPAFVYLIPVLLFFGVARVPSVVATVIYALPPVVRLTCLGIQQVPKETLEAAQAFGATRRQVLAKVQLPIALPMIMAGVNQTIMMALGIVIIAALIGADGLGRDVLFALRRLRVGEALEGGLAIVFMAILLDRTSAAFANRKYEFAAEIQPFRLFSPSLARYEVVRGVESGIDKLYKLGNALARFLLSILLYKLPNSIRRRALIHSYMLFSILILLSSTVFLHHIDKTEFPESLYVSVRHPVDEAVIWAQVNLYEIEGTPLGTGPFSDFVTLQLLNPLRNLLQNWLPWTSVIFMMMLIAARVSGMRLALTTGAGLLAVGFLGMWELAMDTLSQVFVAAVLSIVIGLPLGIWSGRSDFVHKLLRPVLDMLQTIPPFVYLVPVIMLFNLGRVPGILASVLYALPPIIRLTSLGIRQVNAMTIEAAHAFGSTSTQVLRKVEIPLALPSIMMGVNQTLMMVLAMVVIAGLIGGGGLGFEVVSGLAQNELGRGVEAGIAIVIIAIVLDRITQSAVLSQEKAKNIKL